MTDTPHTPEENDVSTTHETFSELFADIPEAEESKTRFISPIPVLPELGMALGLLVLVFGITYVTFPVTPAQNSTEEDYYVGERLTTPPEADIASASIFEDITLTAKSAIVWDVRNQEVLFNKNADQVLPLASITKLMTALVAYELMDAEDRVTISQYALRAEGDSGFVDGESFSMRDLADLTLIASSNDGALALGATIAKQIDSSRNPEDVFVTAMNIKAEELGLTNTAYLNSTGLDLSETEAGAYSTARETALLMEHIIHTIPDAVALTSLEVTRINNDAGDFHLVKNTNEVVDSIDGLIASKTGYTLLAGGNLVLAFNAGLDRPIIVTVLGSTYYDRFDDALTLVQKTQDYLTQQ